MNTTSKLGGPSMGLLANGSVGRHSDVELARNMNHENQKGILDLGVNKTGGVIIITSKPETNKQN